jgi:ATP-dependent RNA helicase DDX5/DBP2
MRLNVDVEVFFETLATSAPIESFEDMNLHPNIMKDIVFPSYITPTPIQTQALHVALFGRDLLGCTKIGFGKTTTFVFPFIQHCLAQPLVWQGDGPLALVLASTRELVQQIEKEVKVFNRSMEGFKTVIFVGGTNIYMIKGQS